MMHRKLSFTTLALVMIATLLLLPALPTVQAAPLIRTGCAGRRLHLHSHPRRQYHGHRHDTGQCLRRSRLAQHALLPGQRTISTSPT